MKKIICLMGLVLAAPVLHAVPNTIDMPTDMSLSGGKWCVSISTQCSNGWSFWQHQSGYHKAGGGIGGANDKYAWDVNLNSPSFDYDNSKAVRAVDNGEISTVNGWGGSSSGQLLINHTTGSDKWSTGYLHMSSIQKKSGTVKKGDIIGYISHVSPFNVPNHLHFIVYNGHNAGTSSVNVGFSGKTALTAAATNLTRLGVTCPASRLNPAQTTNCAATAYYSNGSNKSVTSTATTSWVTNLPSAATVTSQGVVTAKGAASDSNVSISATYKDGAATQQGSASLTVTGLDGKLPAAYGCTADQRNVASKAIAGGSIVLMYSSKCGTNWAKAIPTNSTLATTATVTRTTGGSYSYTGKGTIYTPMVYSPTTKSCASGKIGNVSVPVNTVCR